MADSYQIDPEYVDSTIAAESSGNANATSYDKNGKPIARGLMQLVDSTGQDELKTLQKNGDIPEDTAYDPYNPDLNKQLGTHYLSGLEQKYGDKRLASAAYNWGPANVDKLRSEYGDNYESIAAHLPQETQKYVGRVASGYNKRLANEAPDEKGDNGLAETIKSAAPTGQGFAQSALTVTSDPNFAQLPFDQQAQKMTQVYQAKKWGKEGYQNYQDVMGQLWGAASPDEVPDISQIVGPPPIVPTGQNPETVLSKWRDSETQKLLQEGIPPAYFGGNLEKYFDNAVKAETESFGVRNEGLYGKGADAAGNFVRSLAKGVISAGTDAISGAVRLGSLPNAILTTGQALAVNGQNIADLSPEELEAKLAPTVEATQKRADEVQSIPELLGKPSQSYLYATDQTGKLKLNPDGTPRLNAQEESSITADSVGRAVGQVGAFIGGGWALRAFGLTTGLASTAIGSANALNLANSSFKTVYNETGGDVDKSYTAALMAAPIGFVGELGQLKVIAKEASPVFTAMTRSDQAIYLGKSIAKNAVIGTLTGAGMDAAQQGAEISQTGNSYNPTRTELAAGTAGIAGVLVGSTHDYVQGQVAGYAQGKMRAVGDKALLDFRNSTDTSRVIPVPAVAKDLVETFGITVSGNNDGTVTVTKNGAPPADAPLPQLIKQLRSTLNSDDIKALGARQAELSANENRTPEEDTELTNTNKALTNVSRPEYQNEVKMLEGAIENHLASDPGALLVRRDPDTNQWQDVESGQESNSLKDVLFRKAPPEPEFTKDVSDVSNIRIIDEDEVRARKTEPENPINPLATEEHINVSNRLDEANNKILELQNKRDSLPPKTKDEDANTAEERSKILEDLKEATIAKRQLQQQVIKTKGPRDTEQAALEAQNRTQKAAEKQKTKDIAHIENVKKTSLGKYTSKNGEETLAVVSGLTPEAKTEITAHELAHAVTDKLDLGDAAEKAVDNKIKDLQGAVPAAKASELADRVFLPEARKAIKVPTDLPASKLDKASREAILSRRELLANQIAAVMLKRSGKSIGNYEIIPEVEAALKKTKLPNVEEVGAKKTAQETPTPPAAKTNETAKQEVSELPQVSAKSEVSASSANAAEPVAFNLATGEQAQTRFSKNVTAENPAAPKTFYDRFSRAVGEAEVKAYVDSHGLKDTLGKLSDEKSFNIDPRSRSVLVNEVYERAQAEANANPTPETLKTAELARQVRERAGTIGGQQLALLGRFRSQPTFTDLIAAINRAYTDAGESPPEYSDKMIKELKAKYDAADKLPRSSRARNAEIDGIFKKTLSLKNTGWGSFLAKYARTNLLSGLGTQLVVANSSLYMGPVMTALSHPFQGGGLIWRAMWGAKGLALSNFRATIAGEGGRALFNGVFDPSPVNMGTKPSVEGGFAKLYSKFGDNFLSALSATHGFAKTLSAEGFLASKGYTELKAQYGNDPAKFSAEVSKLILNPKDIEAAKQQATDEYKASGIEPKPGTIGARAYEILRTRSHTPEQLETAEDYARAVSHAGDAGNITHQMALQFFNYYPFRENGYLATVRFIVQPFGRAMIALSDYAIDTIPGNILVDKGLRALGNKISSSRGGEAYFKPRSEALQTRLRNAQIVGTVMASTLLGLSRSGLLKITGDAEKSDLQGEGGATGKATNRADFAEAKQLGEPEYSFIFPGGKSISYKDLPGLNAIGYGLWKVNQALDQGGNIGDAAAQFYRGAFAYSIPFFGGGTLNSPLYNLGQAILHPESDSSSVYGAMQVEGERWQLLKQQSAETAEKFVVPFSSFLRDVQQIYDNPEESHQALLQKTFKNVPGVASLVGSQNSVDRFGEPVQRTLLEHTPGVNRIAGAVSPESGPVWDKLNAKGLIVKEMGNYINFTQHDLGSKEAYHEYQKTRDERLGSAYARTLTPDEWNQFRTATGPYIKAVANSIADADLPHGLAQETLTKRITSIEEQAMKRYVATGQF